MARRSGSSIRTKIYNKFRGVDFTTDPSLVEDGRSPWAPNMVADEGGMPEKRPGWRVLEEFDDPINGLYSIEYNGVRQLLVHTGTKLYRWYEDGETESVLISNVLNNARSTSAYLNGWLVIFTGSVLVFYNGHDCYTGANIAYKPLVVIGRTPAGGGETYEAVNLLSDYQRIGVLGDGSSVNYYLPYSGAEILNVYEVKVNGVVKTAGTDYVYHPATGTPYAYITFTTAPPAPAAGAEDNVYITFRMRSNYADISKCTSAISWGIGGAADRIVCSGNPGYPNRDWICAYNDPTYWPDLNYAVVGSKETAIIGYRRLGSDLAIIKEENGQDSTVFIRSGSLDENGEPVFSVKPALSGVGAVSRNGFSNINDDQLVLTMNGVYALTTNSLTAERIAQPRSRRIDPMLVKEDLSQAICINFNNWMLIFINNQVYGLDGRQAKAYTARNETDFLYEAFYWTNIPARVVMRTVVSEAERLQNGGFGESLYFGTADGKICKFNTDIQDLTKYSDDGAAIEAVWSTKADDDGDAMIYKTLLKKGNAVTLKPYGRSSAKICFRTDRDAVDWQANYDTIDTFSWEDIDFARFTFISSTGPMEIPFKRKIKNYKRLQILIKNDGLNEGFGVFAITKHYVTGNFAKR